MCNSKQKKIIKMVTIEQIELIANRIISEDGWVHDSHTFIEHKGICYGLNRLIKEIKDTKQNE